MNSKEALSLHRENYRAWLENCWNGTEDDPCQLAFEESIKALERETEEDDGKS